MTSVVFSTTAAGMNLNGVTLKSGTIDVNGTAVGVKFDADGDTYLEATTDDILDLYIGGSNDFTWSSNKFEIKINSKIEAASATTVCSPSFTPDAAPHALSGAGAITTTEYYTEWTTTGGDAGTLADADVIGQLKHIRFIVSGGDGTLTPSNLTGGTTITFADVGDEVVL